MRPPERPVQVQSQPQYAVPSAPWFQSCQTSLRASSLASLKWVGGVEAQPGAASAATNSNTNAAMRRMAEASVRSNEVSSSRAKASGGHEIIRAPDPVGTARVLLDDGGSAGELCCGSTHGPPGPARSIVPHCASHRDAACACVTRPKLAS